MRSWFFAIAALVWILPAGAQAATGAGARPSADWSEMQKLEFYIGQLGGALNICGYFELSRDLTELAKLSPYGRKGLASIRVYDSIKGGYCGKLAADGKVLVGDHDKLLAYLQDTYDCVAGQCAPDEGDPSLLATCRAEADEHLMSLPVGTDDIKGVWMVPRNAGATRLTTGKAGHEAWVRLKSCSGWLIIDLSKGCTPRQAFTRGECEIEGISSY